MNCEWDEFGEWTECNASCGGGIQRRRRTVKIRASNGGSPCRGREIETRTCNTQDCSSKSYSIKTTNIYTLNIINTNLLYKN